MKAEAIAKLRAEMEAHKHTAQLGLHLIAYLESEACDPSAAEKILVADKTLDKAWGVLTAAAKKQPSQGGGAMIGPAEVFALTMKYYGIEGATMVISYGAPVASSAPSPTVAPKQEPAAAAPMVEDDGFDLDALLA